MYKGPSDHGHHSLPQRGAGNREGAARHARVRGRGNRRRQRFHRPHVRGGASLGAKVIREDVRGLRPRSQRGFAVATGDLIVTLDGDHSYPVDALSYLLEAFLHLDVDFLNASRFPVRDARAHELQAQDGEPDALAAMSDAVFSLGAQHQAVATITGRFGDYLSRRPGKVVGSKVTYTPVLPSARLDYGIGKDRHHGPGRQRVAPDPSSQASCRLAVKGASGR